MPHRLSPLPPRLLRRNAAADYLGISIQKLSQLVHAGELRYIAGKTPRAPWLFDIRVLDEWVDSQYKRP